ncbi:toprim domain-containing protein [Nostoc sp. CHAB 5834]|nr:toprim domain-containing protein [Nostoc sp. CHAB 5834]
MKSPQTIQQVKNIPITDYLSSIGITPAQKIGHQWFYFSPKTNEKSPSLAVDPHKNVFFDWSGLGKGDILSLVQYLSDCTFLEAVQTLEHFLSIPVTTPFFFGGISSTYESTGVEIVNVKPLQHPALKQYVEKRGISVSIASRYLRQVHYLAKGKEYFALGFPNDSGGYEIRSQYFKGSFSPKAITTFSSTNSATLLLFEGFFDFLSALEYYRKPVLPASVIVLNSLTHLYKILPDLKNYKKVSSFLDSDEAGYKALQKVKSVTANVTDFSSIYNGFKDFNEMLSTNRILTV